MKTPKLLKQIAGVAAIVSSTSLISVPSLAQFYNVYYFPSSYFNPSPGLLQNGEDAAANINDLLAENDQLKEISSYLAKAELTGTLEQKNITLFAPTDKAFESLPVAIREKLEDQENLTKLLKYHLVVGQITNEDIKRQEVETLLGSPVKMVGVSAGNKLQLKLNEAVAGERYSASNGVIIPIDKVLIPPNF
jgi:uncharacterized surface protein with fasciclin (FAS1) repeats